METGKEENRLNISRTPQESQDLLASPQHPHRSTMVKLRATSEQPTQKQWLPGPPKCLKPKDIANDCDVFGYQLIKTFNSFVCKDYIQQAQANSDGDTDTAGVLEQSKKEIQSTKNGFNFARYDKTDIFFLRKSVQIYGSLDQAQWLMLVAVYRRHGFNFSRVLKHCAVCTHMAICVAFSPSVDLHLCFYIAVLTINFFLECHQWLFRADRDLNLNISNFHCF